MLATRVLQNRGVTSARQILRLVKPISVLQFRTPKMPNTDKMDSSSPLSRKINSHVEVIGSPVAQSSMGEVLVALLIFAAIYALYDHLKKNPRTTTEINVSRDNIKFGVRGQEAPTMLMDGVKSEGRVRQETDVSVKSMEMVSVEAKGDVEQKMAMPFKEAQATRERVEKKVSPQDPM